MVEMPVEPLPGSDNPYPDLGESSSSCLYLIPISFNDPDDYDKIEYCQNPVLAKSKRLGVDFVSPLSQSQ